MGGRRDSSASAPGRCVVAAGLGRILRENSPYRVAALGYGRPSSLRAVPGLPQPLSTAPRGVPGLPQPLSTAPRAVPGLPQPLSTAPRVVPGLPRPLSTALRAVPGLPMPAVAAERRKKIEQAKASRTPFYEDSTDTRQCRDFHDEESTHDDAPTRPRGRWMALDWPFLSCSAPAGSAGPLPGASTSKESER